MDKPEEPVEADSGEQISDFDSESCQENPEAVLTTHVSHGEAPSFPVSRESRTGVLMVAVMCLHGH